MGTLRQGHTSRNGSNRKVQNQPRTFSTLTPLSRTFLPVPSDTFIFPSLRSGPPRSGSFLFVLTHSHQCLPDVAPCKLFTKMMHRVRKNSVLSPLRQGQRVPAYAGTLYFLSLRLYPSRGLFFALPESLTATFPHRSASKSPNRRYRFGLSSKSLHDPTTIQGDTPSLPTSRPPGPSPPAYPPESRPSNPHSFRVRAITRNKRIPEPATALDCAPASGKGRVRSAGFPALRVVLSV